MGLDDLIWLTVLSAGTLYAAWMVFIGWRHRRIRGKGMREVR